MSTTYLIKTPDLEFDQMVNFMDQSDESFVTRQIIDNNGTYDNGFIIIANDNIVEVLSAKRVSTSQPKKVYF